MITLLGADGTIAGLVSTRIWGKDLPQDPTLPALVVTNVTSEDDYNAAGADDLVQARFQIDCWATTYAVCLQLANAVRSKLSGYSGAAGSESVKGSFKRSSNDETQDSTGYHRRMLEFEIFYTE